MRDAGALEFGSRVMLWFRRVGMRPVCSMVFRSRMHEGQRLSLAVAKQPRRRADLFLDILETAIGKISFWPPCSYRLDLGIDREKRSRHAFNPSLACRV